LAQELSEKALASRISSLICDLVFLADSLGVDLESSLTTELERHAPTVNALACVSPHPVQLDEPLSA
jgi:hypothetical protein